jgi:hypothetical protein
MIYDICLMCPFPNGFKGSLNDDLGKLQREQGKICLSVQSKKDLLIWARFLMDKLSNCFKTVWSSCIQKRVFFGLSRRQIIQREN